MAHPTSFADLENNTFGAAFLKDGYVITSVEDPASLDAIRNLIVRTAAEFLYLDTPNDPDIFLNNVDKNVNVEKLNGLRLACIQAIRTADWFRPSYASLAYVALTALTGNELAMQRGIGLSVQLPNDKSSLLAIHADTWDGDSPYEVVQWVPIVNCFKTKSMYIVPRDVDRALQKDLSKGRFHTAEDIFLAVKDDVIFLDVPYGSVLLFSQTIAHGNRINVEPTTRWSMNCRFKSILSPYIDKKLGEFFEPISIRPATRLGLDYKLPGRFDG